MQASSPTFFPKTPSYHDRNPLQYRPLNSPPPVTSPESPKSSPVAARRKSQYKAQFPVTPSNTRCTASTPYSARRICSSSVNGDAGAASGPDAQKVLLRDRRKAQCLERASKARETVVRGQRRGCVGEPSSDDLLMHPDDDEEDDDAVMQDELFRRIMTNADRKREYAYRVSYAREVGSAFDPDVEGFGSWEQELADSNAASAGASSTPLASTSVAIPPSDLDWVQDVDEVELTQLEMDSYLAESYGDSLSLEGRLDSVKRVENTSVEENFNSDLAGLVARSPNSAIQDSGPLQDDLMDVS